MASVSVVSASSLRTSLSSQQNAAPEDGEPFSLLLNAVADVEAPARRPEAPRVPERRADAPAKPDADTERQARRRAPDAETAEAKPQQEPPAPAKLANEDGEETEGDADGENAAADALLLIALQEPQQVAVSAPASTDANAAPVVAAPMQAALEAPAATADMSAAVPSEAPLAQTAQHAAAAKAQSEIAAPVQAEAEAETVLPKISAETLSSLLKPQRTAAPLEAQARVQPQAGSANPGAAATLQAPTQLEMLNAAIGKQAALSRNADAGQPQPDAPKPLLSSNAVAPNFAMTTQASAPVSAPPQQHAEAARAVPLEQLAVEIATRASKGERRFDIRLDPPELGRIDVRLEIDHKGNTTTKLIVERAETLDLLQRDARGLEKALQSAGLKTDAGGLEFSLRQDAQTQQGSQNAGAEPRGWSAPAPAESEGMTEVSINSASLAAQLRGGVDIRI